MSARRLRTIPGDPDGRTMEARISLGFETPGVLDGQADGAVCIVGALIRAAAALAGPAEAVRQVTSLRLDFSVPCVELTAVVFEGQEPQQVQQDLLAAVQAVPVTVGATAIASARAAALRQRSTFSTGPEAAQRWEQRWRAPAAQGEYARTEEIAAASKEQP